MSEQDGITDPKAQAKIDILFKEYDSLRQEIIARINARFLILGLFGALLAFLLTRRNLAISGDVLGVNVKLIIAAVGLGFLLFIWIFFGFLIEQAGTRVSAIEKRINELAGEELLVWETRSLGRWGRFLNPRRDAT